MGIVTESKVIREKVTSLLETRIEQHPLSIGVVAHASVIKETIYMLPDIEDKGIQKNSQGELLKKEDGKEIEPGTIDSP